MTIDETIDSEKRIQKIKELEDKVTGIKSTNPEYHQQIAEWLKELKDYRDKNKMVVRIDVENLESMKDKCIEIAKEQYNKATAECIDKFADILSNIKEMCGRNCPVNCNWGTTTNCKDMCKKWLAEQLMMRFGEQKGGNNDN